MSLKKPEIGGKQTSTQISRAKWGDTLIDAGYAITPTVLIKHFVPVTGLDSVDLHIVEFINTHWWGPIRPAYPSKAAIAEAIGLDPNTVRRRIQEMERRGLIKRVQRRSRTYNNTNIYLLDGLKKVLEPCAAKQIKDRKIKAEQKTLRAKQMRAGKSKLSIVKT
jgi:hypothetical protein